MKTILLLPLSEKGDFPHQDSMVTTCLNLRYYLPFLHELSLSFFSVLHTKIQYYIERRKFKHPDELDAGIPPPTYVEILVYVMEEVLVGS